MPRDCDGIIAALPDEVLGLSANSPKSPFKGITKEELLNSPLVKDLEAHEFKEAQKASANGATKAKKVNAQKSPKAHKENTQKAQWDKPLVANDEFSYHDNPLLKSKATDSNDKFSYRDNPLLKYKSTDSNNEASQADEPNSPPPRVFGRAAAPLKKYKKKNKNSSVMAYRFSTEHSMDNSVWYRKAQANVHSVAQGVSTALRTAMTSARGIAMQREESSLHGSKHCAQQ